MLIRGQLLTDSINGSGDKWTLKTQPKTNNFFNREHDQFSRCRRE